MAKTWTLVTGASGFLGAHLVRMLIDRGESVKGFVRAGSDLSLLEGLPGDRFTLAVGDVLVDHTMYRALASCDRVYHLAAEHEHWGRHPERITAAIVDGTKNLMDVCKKRRIKKIVVTSTALTLGASSSQDPMNETSKLNLSEPVAYVRAKAHAEELALEMASQGYPIVTVLPTAVVGPGDRKPTPTGRFIVRYLRMSPLWHAPIVAGGINLVDVDDVARGHLLAMDKGRIGERYVLGGENMTYEQCTELLSELTALPPPGRQMSKGTLQMLIRFGELKARLYGGVPLTSSTMVRDFADRYVWVSTKKAETELGYAPSPVRPALARSVRWFLANGYVPEKAARRVHLQPTMA